MMFYVFYIFYEHVYSGFDHVRPKRSLVSWVGFRFSLKIIIIYKWPYKENATTFVRKPNVLSILTLG